MTRDCTGKWKILYLALFNLFGKTFSRENSKLLLLPLIIVAIESLKFEIGD